MPLSVTFEWSAYKNLPGKLSTFAGAWVSDTTLIQAGTKIVLKFLQEEAPVKTGRLRRSITAKSSGPQGSGFYALAYGRMLAHGTRPHTITPKNAQVLAFEWKGEKVFFKSVNHPGTKPNDFPRRAVQKAKPALRVLMAENGRRLVRAHMTGKS